MRIIGGRDYYDSGLGYGHDENTTYVRGDTLVPEAEMRAVGILPAHLDGTLLEEGTPKKQKGRQRWYRTMGLSTHMEFFLRSTDFRLEMLTVIACGVRYQGLRVDVSPRYGSADIPRGAHYFWDLESFRKWLSSVKLDFSPVSESEMERYFVPTPVSSAVRQVLVDRRWSVLVHNPGRPRYSYRDGTPWMVDQPVLRDVEFVRAVPVPTMFQELDMWLGGVLPAQGNPVVEVSDTVRLEKHGFHKRTSFRKPKQG